MTSNVVFLTRRRRSLSDDTINLIRNIYDTRGDIPGITIAKMFNVSAPRISLIGKRKYYRDVPFKKICAEELCSLIRELLLK